MGCLKKIWTPLRDTAETAATLAGNYYLPGSSLLTSHLVSKGSQDQLGSPLGTIANIGSGLAGSGAFEGVDAAGKATGIPSSATSMGGGWTNFGNNVGSLANDGTLGTDTARAIGNATNSVTSGISNALSGAGRSLGLTSSDPASSSPGFFSRLFGSDTNPTSGLDSASVDMQSPSAIGANAFKSGSLASPSLSAGIGGGSSAYGGISGGQGLAAILGGVNSLSANDKAQKDLLDAERNAMGQLDPYLKSGQAANSRLSELLGTGGNTGASDYGSLTKQFDPSQLTSDPGYQFQLSQGNQAIDRKAAAGGNYFSGAALKAAEDYGTGLANTTYADAFNRDQSTKQQQYGMFSGQNGAGQTAANSAGDLYAGIGNAKANAGISSSNILNNTLSSLLSGSGAKRFLGYGQNGQPIYA